MSYKMRVLIKRPNERYGHICNISNSLENLQRTVEGYIETVRIGETADGKPIILVCNEEGKIKGLEHNMYIGNDEIVGTFILCSVQDEEFTDLPATFGLAEWKQIVTQNTWR